VFSQRVVAAKAARVPAMHELGSFVFGRLSANSATGQSGRSAWSRLVRLARPS
jgi:hypothetical protein